MGLTNVLQCPACRGSDLNDRGAIPAASVFAGQPLEQPIPGGKLLECRVCRLNWRSVVCTSAFYDALYAQAGGDEWQSGEPRRDHQLIADALSRRVGSGDVLDVGCGNGALLDLLPKTFKRFGVEIGQEARAAARSRGVELVGASFDDLISMTRTFDAVIACDVIEHALNPQAFLVDAIRLLRPGGVLILSTGNADSWLWRLLGGRFWYAQFAEHLAFLTPQWLARQRPSGAKLLELKRFSYRAMSMWSRFKSILLLGFYVISPAGFARWAGARGGWAQSTPYFPNPPGNGLTRDHMVATLQRVELT